MKYEIVNGRCVALRDFSNVRKGDFGGHVEPGCLSQEGNCWVYYNAKVSEGARISGDAKITGNAQVSGYARISGEVRVLGYAIVTGKASGKAEIITDLSGEAIVISGLLPWTITVTDNHIKIGCQCGTKDWWRRASVKGFGHLDSRAIDLWNKYEYVLRRLLC